VGLSLQIVTIDSVLNWLKDIVPFYNINTDAIAIAKSSSHIEIFAVGIQSTSAVQAAIFGIQFPLVAWRHQPKEHRESTSSSYWRKPSMPTTAV